MFVCVPETKLFPSLQSVSNIIMCAGQNEPGPAVIESLNLDQLGPWSRQQSPESEERRNLPSDIAEEHDEDCDCVCGCDMIFAVAAAARGDNGLLDPGPAHINHTTRDIARRHRSYTDPANPGTSQQ